MSLEVPSSHLSDERIDASVSLLKSELVHVRSIDRLFLDTEKYYQHLGTPGKAELLRFERFAWFANNSQWGVNTHTAYAFYKGEVAGLAVAGTLAGEPVFPSDDIQEVINGIFNNRTVNHMKMVGRKGKDEKAIPVPKDSLIVHERRQTETADLFMQDYQDAPGELGNRYQEINKIIDQLTEHLSVREAVMTRAGFWLVVKETLEPSGKSTKDADTTKEDTPSTPIVIAPVEDLLSDIQALDTEMREHGLVPIDDAVNKLVAETRSRKTALPHRSNLDHIGSDQKSLEESLNTYVKEHLSLDTNTLISLEGEFFYFTDGSNDKGTLEYTDTKGSLFIRGAFEKVVVHKAPTPKTLKKFDPEYPRGSELVYDPLTPHLRLTDAILIDTTDKSAMPLPGKTDIPLTYPTLHIQAAFMDSLLEGE